MPKRTATAAIQPNPPAVQANGGTETPNQPVALSRTAKGFRENVQDRLENLFEDFLKTAWYEEKAFLCEVLTDWDNDFGGYPKQAGDFEVPIYSAIERNISGARLVKVEDEHMIEAVNEFLRGLKLRYRLNGREKEKKDDRTRLSESLSMEYDDFMEHAGLNDIRFAIDLFRRHANDEGPQPLRVIAGLESARAAGESA